MTASKTQTPQPVDPATVHLVPGFRGMDGTVYADPDERLLGMGNPPACPAYCAARPGSGHLRMTRELVTVAEIDPDHRPDPSTWIPAP